MDQNTQKTLPQAYELVNLPEDDLFKELGLRMRKIEDDPSGSDQYGITIEYNAGVRPNRRPKGLRPAATSLESAATPTSSCAGQMLRTHLNARRFTMPSNQASRSPLPHWRAYWSQAWGLHRPLPPLWEPSP